MSAKDSTVSICKKNEVALLECINTEAVCVRNEALKCLIDIIKAMESNNKQNESSCPTLKRHQLHILTLKHKFVSNQQKSNVCL